ncbi:MAG: MarR family transcriptional regulator, partial [Stackebrandtia sp.]
RRLIAEAMAEGLGFAEVARRLGRPTSTVSREVARNGGRGGYRADGAQRATGRRAHRAAPVPASAKPRSDGSYRRDESAVRRFRDRYTAMMVETGLPPITAGVLVCLLMADERYLTAADLVGRLRVSPASVSKAVAYLESLGMLRREREPGGRRDRYLVDGDDGWHRAWSRTVELHSRWADEAGEGARVLGRQTPAGARLAEMAEFTGRLRDTLAREIARWEAEAARRRNHDRG